MSRVRLLNYAGYFVGLSLILCLIGCATSSTSKNLVAQFGKTSAKLTQIAEPAFSSVREAQRKHILSSAMIEKDSGNMARWAGRAPSMNLETVDLRIALLKELGKYGEALQVLASDNELERVDKASIELSEALGSLNSTSGKLRGTESLISDESLEIVATGVNAISRWNFEKIRLKALASVTSQADPVIQEIVKIFRCELATDEAAVQKLKCESIKGRGNWQESLKLALQYDAENQVFLARRMSANPKDINEFEKREAFIQNAIDLNIRKNAVDDEFQNIDNALQSLAATHSKMVNALQEDEATPDAIGALSRFSAEVTRLEGFYASLGTEETGQ